MAIFTNAVTLTGATTNDYLVGDSATTANTLFGGDGNDHLLGDADIPITMALMAGAGTSAGNAFAINADSTYWSNLYNPDIANSTTIPHATAIIEGNGSYQWFAVTLLGGQVLTLDADYGVGSNLELRLFQADGTTLVTSNDNAVAITDGANGSTSVNDPFLTYTAPGSILTSTTYLIRVAEGLIDPTDAGDSYVLHMSLTGQPTDTSSSGNDVLNGGNGNDIIYGIGGDDIVNGDAGNDYMTGDEGNDTLDGGAGSDTMYGGNNNDTFVVTNGFNTAAGDQIYGGLMTDTLDLSALTGLTNVVVNLATGSFTSSLAASITTIVEVENVIGTAFNDTITGSDVNNTLFGGAGDDTLTGGLGTDKFFGGAGNDTFITNSSGETVTEAVGGGTNDRIIASASASLATGSEVEFMLTDNAAGTTSINLTGNALAQTITGNAGNNSLDDGGAGAADTLTGLAGNDIYYVSNAGTIIVENAIFSGGLPVASSDRVSASVSFALAADDDIEAMNTNSSSSTTAINLTGNALKQTITGNNGDNVLNSGGGVADTLTGSLGNDTYVVNNAGDVIGESTGQGTLDRVNAAVSFVLDSSDDIEILQTVSAAATTAINLTGNLLAQGVIGNAGANILDGKLGDDTLVGGAGADIFAFSTAGGAGNTDTISDFVIVDDQIRLDPVAFAALTVASGAVTGAGVLAAGAFEANATGTATLAATRIVYNTATGALFYDADGTGGTAAVQFATLTGAPVISAADINVIVPVVPGNTINGTAGNDNLVGTNGVDVINGLAGDDTLSGGLGNDVNNGGAGNDTYIVESSSDIVNELAGEGTNDRVFAQGTYALQAGSQVEVIQTTSFAGTASINLTGNALAQSIIGNAGNNSLDDGGAAAADTLTGGAGNDIYYVSNASTLIVENAGGGTADRVSSRVSFTLAADDDIEAMTTISSTATTAINLTGNALAQSITGNNGDNVLDSFLGGNDTLTGLLGNDTYIIRNASDVIGESAGQGTADRVLVAFNYVLDASDDIEVLQTTSFGGTAAINLTGNALAQTVTGNAGANVLSDGGGAGADTMFGSLGNDTYLVGNSGTIVTEAAGGGTDVVQASTSFTLTAGSEVETIQTNNAIGNTAINLTGNALAQSITGNIASNTLNDGATGASDTLTGLAGDDIYVVNNSGTIIVEAIGEGIADEVWAAVNFALAADDDIEILTTNNAAGTTAINLTGNALSQQITGNAGNNTLDSGVGVADTMTGGAGNDVYFLRNAGDVFVEGAAEGTADEVRVGVDYTLDVGSNIEILSTNNAAGTTVLTLTGNALAQTINGNNAASTLIGLAGDDTYTVNNAATTVTEAAAEGMDRVNASVSYALGAGQEIETLATTNDAGTGILTLTGNALAQTIIGNNAASTLVGLGGNDVYTVNNAGTVVTEAVAGGSDTVNASVSYVLTAGSEVEILQTTNAAGTGSINLTGNALAQTITGNAGINTLNDGSSGGVDTLVGLQGNDTYIINSVGTVVTEVASGGSDTVTSVVNFTLGAGSEVETIQTNGTGGTTNLVLVGNALAQTITGNAGNNTLNDGGAGASDTLAGLVGNDTYIVNNTGTIITEAAASGTDTVQTSVSYVLGAAADIETFSTTNAAGTGAINLTGNAIAQTITGNAGANVIDGLAGNDVLVGGLGADTFVFSTALNATTNLDQITGFVAVDDTLRLANAIFGALGGTMLAVDLEINATGSTTVAGANIVYNSATGALFYDADSTGAGASIQFATLTGAPAGLTISDFTFI